MISVCLPTRGRPDRFLHLCQTLLDLADKPDEIEIISYHDNDDPSRYQYIGNHKEIVGDRIVMSDMWNKCWEKATGPIYMVTMDDIVFMTKGWDTQVYGAFDKYPDKIAYVYFASHPYMWRLGSTFCLHKNWTDTIGRLLPPYFPTHLSDNWINDIAKGLNRRHYLYYAWVMQDYIYDQTKKDYDVRHKQYPPWPIYRRKRRERVGEMEKLKKFIEEYQCQNLVS